MFYILIVSLQVDMERARYIKYNNEKLLDKNILVYKPILIKF